MENAGWMSKPLSRQDQKKPKPFLKHEKQFISSVATASVWGGEGENPHDLAQVDKHVWISFLANGRHGHILTMRVIKYPTQVGTSPTVKR